MKSIQATHSPLKKGKTMKHNSLFSAAAILTVFSLATAHGQENSAPPEALTSLMRLEGRWQRADFLFREGRTHKVNYRADFRMLADGSGLYLAGGVEAELGGLKGANLIGYDVNDGKIHWYRVLGDSIGTTRLLTGGWKSPDHFQLQTSETEQGKEFLETIDLVFKGPDALDFHLSATLDGQPVEESLVTYHRIVEAFAALNRK